MDQEPLPKNQAELRRQTERVDASPELLDLHELSTTPDNKPAQDTMINGIDVRAVVQTVQTAEHHVGIAPPVLSQVPSTPVFSRRIENPADLITQHGGIHDARFLEDGVARRDLAA